MTVANDAVPNSGRDTTSRRVLVIDDELSIRRLLRQYLVKDGFAVIEVDNGLDAVARAAEGTVDIALVDVMLPGMDGFEVVRQIRGLGSTIPLIMLTARGEETQRVAGLELGADDYVVKPFSAPEVVARVRAHLRRLLRVEAGVRAAPVRVGGVEVDVVGRRCTAGGNQVDLTRREFDLLRVLAEHPGRVFSRAQLLELVWETSYLSEKTVDVHVASLRHKLGDHVGISALRGVGYRLDV